MTEQQESIRITRCSYCGNQGHNITTCNNQDIHNFRKLCLGNRLVFDVETSSQEQSKEKFMEWILCASVNVPQLVLVFASRFCRVPSHIDFIHRSTLIRRYIYDYAKHEILEIINPANNIIINLALTNCQVLRGMIFDERVDYLNRIVLYLEVQRRNKKPEKFKILATLDNSEKELEIVECPICYEEKSKHQCIDLNCCHTFCGDCFISTLKTTIQNEATCSLCRESVKNVVVYDVNLMEQLALLIE